MTNTYSCFLSEIVPVYDSVLLKIIKQELLSQTRLQKIIKQDLLSQTRLQKEACSRPTEKRPSPHPSSRLTKTVQTTSAHQTLLPPSARGDMGAEAQAYHGQQ